MHECIISSDEAEGSGADTDITHDGEGRTLCKRHRLERCEICCMDFVPMNQYARLSRSGEEPPAPDPLLAQRIADLKARGDDAYRQRQFKDAEYWYNRAGGAVKQWILQVEGRRKNYCGRTTSCSQGCTAWVTTRPNKQTLVTIPNRNKYS